MPRKVSLKKIADELIGEARQPFSTDEFASQVQERWRGQIAASTLENLKKGLAGHRFLIGLNDNGFLPYRAVLEKTGHIPLALPLTALEVKRRILIPGCRLVPFLSRDLLDEEMTLLTPAGAAVPKTRHTFLLEDVFEYYRYADERHFPDRININDKIPAKSSITVTAWDMDAVFTEFGVRQGGALQARIVDYGRGIFKLQPYPEDDRRRARLRLRRFYLALEETLLSLSGCYDFSCACLEKQLLRALYALKDDVLAGAPAFSLTEFIQTLRKLAVIGCERGYPRFVPDGNSQRWETTMELAPRNPTGRSGSLDDILEDLGLPFDRIQFKAILRAAVAREKCFPMEQVVDLLFGGKGKLFCDGRQEEKFYRYIRREMQQVYLDAENPEPRLLVDLREQTVRVKLCLVRMLKYLEFRDVDLMDLPRDVLEQVIDLDHFCAESLVYLEHRGRPTDIKIVREMQIAHRIIAPKLRGLEDTVYHQLGVY